MSEQPMVVPADVFNPSPEFGPNTDLPTQPGFSYSGDPTTSYKDEIRFLIADTDPAFPLLNDNEIAFLWAKWYNRYGQTEMVAAFAAKLISRKFAGVLTVTTGSGVSVPVGDLSTRYATMAQQLMDEAKEAADAGAEIDVASLLEGFTPDASIAELNFGIGMTDNPLAGKQSFGESEYLRGGGDSGAWDDATASTP